VIYSKGEKTFASAKALPSGLLALMSISIKKRASASAVLAVTVWCWRVSAHCSQRRTAGRRERHRAAAGIRDEGQNAFLPGHLALIQKHYPDCQVTIKELHDRVFGMFMSNYVGITRHDDMPVVHFTLNSVDPRYYIESAKNKRA
jgi:hypothetical protein